eukprot:2213724-Pyramimonas_sp.AAC.1
MSRPGKVFAAADVDGQGVPRVKTFQRVCSASSLAQVLHSLVQTLCARGVFGARVRLKDGVIELPR